MEEVAIIESEDLKYSVSRDNFVNLVLQTVEELDKQVLVFNNSKRGSEAAAVAIAKEMSDKRLKKEELKKISQKILEAVSMPTKQCRKLADVVLKGVAFHHSGLTAKQRNLIEKGFKAGFIKVISSTPTLAAGLNLPAYKVIIKDYKRYSQRGFNDIPILEFHQMSGRAGRPGKEDVGKAVVLVKSDDEQKRISTKYIFGKPEEIISKLAVEPILKMQLLSLISMNLTNTEEEIESFFSNTFYAFQYQDMESFKYNLFRIVDQLKSYKFVLEDDRYFQATPIGKKVSELYLNPDTAYYFYKNIDRFIKKFSVSNVSKYDVYSLIFFVANTLEMKPLFRVSKAEEDYYIKRAEEVGDDLIVGFDPFDMDYENFLSLIKISDLFLDWISEAHEDYLNEKYKVTPGELNYKIEIIDWLFYCLEEFALMKKNFYFKNFLSKLRIRFKYGVSEELLALISIKGVGRVRARKLYKGGFKKIYDLRKAPLNAIARVVGEKVAIKIKTEVGNLDLDSGRQNLEKKLDKPKEIKVREVSDDEVEELVRNAFEFEKEKEEKQRKLTSFF